MKRRAVFCHQPQHTDLPRQQRHVLALADRMGLDVVTFTVGLDEDELLALIRGGFVEVVLIDLATEGSDRLAEVLERAGGQLHAVYRRQSVARVRMTGAVRAAASRGASVAAIAQVFGMTEAEVEITLALPVASPRTERCMMLPRPEPGQGMAGDEPRPQQRSQLVPRPQLVNGDQSEHVQRRSQLVERRPARAS